MSRRALITGITGQDGSYLAEYLLSEGYEVHGLIRRASTFNTSRIEHLYVDPHAEGARLFLHYGDLSDAEQVSNIIHSVEPDEVYNLGSQSHVRVSFDIPEYTGNITALGVARILEAIRRSRSDIRFYNAASSEMFGSSAAPQSEDTEFHPRSPYAVAKLYGYWMCVNYRDGYGIHATNGILFNHESPRRGETFVTRKISRAVAGIVVGKQKHIYLGNLQARRDWGYAPEYVELMHKMVREDNPGDYVVGTGVSHSVKDFLDLAFDYADLDPEKHMRIDERYLRPTDVSDLIADSSKAEKRFGWKPKLSIGDLVKVMVDADLRAAGCESIGEGDALLAEKYPNRWWGVD